MKTGGQTILTLLFFFPVMLGAQGVASETPASDLLFPPAAVTATSPLATDGLLFLPGELASQPAFVFPDPVGTTLQVMLSLIIVLALVFGLSYLLQQRVGLNRSVFGRVLGVLPLDGRRFVYLVDVMGKVLVLGVTEQNINLLSEITDKTSVDALRLQNNSSGIPSLEKLFPFLRRKDVAEEPLSQGELAERTRQADQQREIVEKLLLKRERPRDRDGE